MELQFLKEVRFRISNIIVLCDDIEVASELDKVRDELNKKIDEIERGLK